MPNVIEYNNLGQVVLSLTHKKVKSSSLITLSKVLLMLRFIYIIYFLIDLSVRIIMLGFLFLFN